MILTRQPQWAALFDWDGVIIDSAVLHRRSWEVVAGRRGLSLPEGYFERSFGLRNQEIIPGILDWASEPAAVEELAFDKEASYRELVRDEGLDPLPGVAEWLAALVEAGIPCGVGSSTPRANIECVLEQLGIGNPFQAVVTAEDVSRGKPDPEVFQQCARRLGAAPGCGVVFEDAPMGVEAGLAGGFRVVAVRGTHGEDGLGSAHRIVQRLDELRVEELDEWFA